MKSSGRSLAVSGGSWTFICSIVSFEKISSIALSQHAGAEVTVRINTDASAAKGTANRKGLGKVRHIVVNQLWIQDRIARGDLTISKVNGKDNIADSYFRAVVKYLSINL